MKTFVGLSVFSFAVLGTAAIWMGGLNQDEGWYLYAAQLVSEGQWPYRDFFYTQGPLMPLVYSAFSWVWRFWGILGARVFNFAVGAFGLLLAVVLVRRLVPPERRGLAGTIVFFLLGSNLYHLYYLAIPKTYALAGLFTIAGFLFLALAAEGRKALALVAGLSLAFAAGTRISLGALLAVCGVWLLMSRQWKSLVLFCIGGFAGLALVYGPFLFDPDARTGIIAAQAYHAARGGFDPVWTVGSFSRLVRWYLPVFVLLGIGLVLRVACPNPREGAKPADFALLPFWGFLAVFTVQMLAPFPYEDYQVPVMGLLAVVATVLFTSTSTSTSTFHLDLFPLLLVLGMTWAGSFGSPLLEQWSTNGQDRFWSLKKQKSELAQLRDVAREIEAMDPGGKDIFTQDLYLAIETGRKVPKGLEMGPFAMLSDREWRQLLSASTCRVAALSGYAFAIRPPLCDERPVEQQLEYWSLLKRHYKLVMREENFGQNHTTLLVLERK